MKQYHVRSVSIANNLLEEALNDLSEDRWELNAIVPVPSEGKATLIMERDRSYGDYPSLAKMRRNVLEKQYQRQFEGMSNEELGIEEVNE